MKDYELIFSKIVYLFGGTSPIHVKFVDFVQREMRDTSTMLLPALKIPIAHPLSSSVKHDIFKFGIQYLGYPLIGHSFEMVIA